MVEFSVPMRPMLDSVFAGVVNGRALLRLLDQIELLNGVVDHRPLALPRMDCDKTENPTVSRGGVRIIHEWSGPDFSCFYLF